MKRWLVVPMLLGALTAGATEALEEEIPLSEHPLWDAVLESGAEFEPAPLESESQEVIRPAPERDPEEETSAS